MNMYHLIAGLNPPTAKSDVSKSAVTDKNPDENQRISAEVKKSLLETESILRDQITGFKRRL